jgi:hypothetical protein
MLSDWSGTSIVLLSMLRFGVGFVCAIALARLCFGSYAAFVGKARSQLSIWHLSLLFACATWSIFFALLAMKPERLLQGFGAVNVVVIASIVLAPVSILAGIPVFLVYVIRRPVIHSRAVYLAAGAICLTSYLYLIWLEQAFRDGS